MQKTYCFKCGAEIARHILYCPECNRRQPILMEGLDRAFDDDIQEKIKTLEAELDADQKNFYRHFILGNAIFLAGDYQGAVHRYRMALDLKPSFSDAKLNSGYVLHLLGDSRAAISMLEEFRRENPHSNKVEGVLKLIYELKGLPWHTKKKESTPIPEIVKPRKGRKDAALKRERVYLPALIFVLLIAVLITFGLVRRDVMKAAYDHAANTVGEFLSGHVSSTGITSDESDTEEGGTSEESEEKHSGSDLLSRLFNRRQAEEALEDDEDFGDDPAKGPPVETPDDDEDEGYEEEKKRDPNEPVNIDPESDNYWPMKIGSVWEYEGLELNSRGGLVEGSEKTGSIKVIRKIKSEDTPIYEVKNLGATSYFYENSDGVFQVRDPDHPWSSSVPSIEKPVVVGEKWTDQRLGMGYEVMEEIDIEVPAGLFRTVRIKTWILDYPEYITEIFFGQGIGPVKLVTGATKKGFRIWELSSYPEG